MYVYKTELIFQKFTEKVKTLNYSKTIISQTSLIKLNDFLFRN